MVLFVQSYKSNKSTDGINTPFQVGFLNSQEVPKKPEKRVFSPSFTRACSPNDFSHIHEECQQT